MPTLFLNSPSFSGLVWIIKFLPSKHTVNGMIGHSAISFRDQYIVLYDNKHWTDTIMSDSYYNSHINKLTMYYSSLHFIIRYI